MRPIITLGVSACLLGQAVRYDGAHQAHAYVLSRLSRRFKLKPICPEVEVGLGVPRPPIRLVGPLHYPEAQGKYDPSINPTQALRALGKQVAVTWLEVCGFVVKSRSPSCGLRSTKVLVGQQEIRAGTGLFTEQLCRNTRIPVIEETDLDDVARRRAFIAAVFQYFRTQRNPKLTGRESSPRLASLGFCHERCAALE